MEWFKTFLELPGVLLLSAHPSFLTVVAVVPCNSLAGNVAFRRVASHGPGPWCASGDRTQRSCNRSYGEGFS